MIQIIQVRLRNSEKNLKSLVNDYEELSLITDDFGTHIEFTGDASQAEEVINNFMNDVKEASKLVY